MRKALRTLAALALLAGCSETLSPEDYYGIWGAEGVRLTLSATQARFETSCWAGDMAVPIQVDDTQITAIGNIHWQGGAGGNDTRAVILVGHRDGDVLRLTVETSFPLGPYTLHRGAQADIPGCP